MPYVLRLATPDSRDLVVAALRSAADQRTRVATKAAREVAATKAGGRDVRAQAVKVTMLLAEAADLGALADELAAATEVAVMSVDQAGNITTGTIPDPAGPHRYPGDPVTVTRENLGIPVTTDTIPDPAAVRIPPLGTFPGEQPDPAVDEDTPPADVDTDPNLGDDGTSQEAQRLAALAGLTPADPDRPTVEDPDTHALPEDEPGEAVEEVDLDEYR